MSRAAANGHTTKGERLAARTGWEFLRIEGHDLIGQCPACPSSDALHLHEDRGTCHCFSCGMSFSPQAFAEKFLGSTPAAIQCLVDIGLYEDRQHNGNGQSGRQLIDPLVNVAAIKRVAKESLMAYGGCNSGDKVVFPMYAGDGTACSTISLGTDGGKGMYAPGKPHGVFLPHDEKGNVRLPQAGETWHLVEGPKDAAALHEQGILAAGLPTSFMAAHFARLFRGVNVLIVPDRDEAGENGARKTAAGLYGVAASIRIATLPLEFKKTKGQDVRDLLRKANGRELLTQALADAQPWEPSEGEIIEQASDTSEVIVRTEPPSRLPPIQYTRLTAAELDAGDFELSYFIDNILVAGQPCIIGGPKKALKTSIMLDLAVSLCLHGHFLGVFPVIRAARVAVMTGESGLATVQETLRSICATMDKRLSDVSGLIVSPDLPKFGDIRHHDALGRFLDDDEIEVLMLDPAYLCMPGADAANVFLMGELLRSMAEICTARGVTMILAHHTVKHVADPFAPTELESIAFAGFQEFARQWLLLARRERYEPGSGFHKLWLSSGGSAGHGGLWGLDVNQGIFTPGQQRLWDVTLHNRQDLIETERNQKDEAVSNRKQQKLDGLKKRIANAAAKYKAGETKNIIKTAAGISGTDADAAFLSLVDDGVLVPCEVFKPDRKTPRQGFKLAGEAV